MIVHNTLDSSVPSLSNSNSSVLTETLRWTEQLRQLDGDTLRSLVQHAARSELIPEPEQAARFLVALAQSISAHISSAPLEETARAADPARGELLSIRPEKILILPKLSKIEWDLIHQTSTLDNLLRDYDNNGLDADRILAAHTEHNATMQRLQQELPEARFMQVHGVDTFQLQSEIKRADLVIITGGDDHFKEISQHIKDTFVAVINSDPVHSVGAAAYYNRGQIHELIDSTTRGAFVVEDWQRLNVRVNGKEYSPAISEVAIAENQFKFGSRGLLDCHDQQTAFKGSGLIVGTGYGSTGWFQSAARYIQPSVPPWARTAPRAGWVQREPYGDISYPTLTHGTVTADTPLEITSELKHSGLLSIDSILDVPFPRGTRATIGLHDSPLKVIRIASEPASVH